VTTVTLLVPDMTCRHCVRTVTAALRDVAGVQLVAADARTTRVELHGEPVVTDVITALEAVGFPGTVLSAREETGRGRPAPRRVTAEDAARPAERRAAQGDPKPGH
jgi:copper chaperone CopZ